MNETVEERTERHKKHLDCSFKIILIKDEETVFDYAQQKGVKNGFPWYQSWGGIKNEDEKDFIRAVQLEILEQMGESHPLDQTQNVSTV